MKASFIMNYGNLDVMEFGEVSQMEPTKGTVLVSVKVCSINPLDYKIRSGYLKSISGSKFPKILGSDFSGVIVKLGEGVNEFKVGDSVYGAVKTIFGKQGALAEFVVAEKNSIRKVPDNWSMTDAASLPVAALTALNGFRQCGDLSGKKILINGATGGVGHFALQIAKHSGAEITAVCSEKNFSLARDLGATHVLDYTKIDILKDSIKYDIIFDAAAKLNFSSASFILTNQGYYISTLLVPILSQIQTLYYKLLGGKKLVAGDMRAKPEDFEKLESLVSSGKLKPFIGQIFPLEKAKDALEIVESGKARGKILVKIQ